MNVDDLRLANRDITRCSLCVEESRALYAGVLVVVGQDSEVHAAPVAFCSDCIVRLVSEEAELAGFSLAPGRTIREVSSRPCA